MRGGPSRVVIVGAGLAGGSAALALREAGFDGEVVLVGSEAHPPYARPPMSKEFLRGERVFEQALLRPADEYERLGIELRNLAVAVAIDPAAREVRLAGGEALPYDRLILATGSRNRPPGVPGEELAGVLDLRTVEDAERIRRQAHPGSRVVIVGMGFIGSEVAASLRSLGLEVTAVLTGGGPLDRVLGPEVSAVLAAIHTEHGVHLVRGARVAAFEGSNGRVERAVTDSGQGIECDFAVVGVGVVANVEVAAEAGLTVESGGVAVDEWCGTGTPDVLAAGDVASFPYPAAGRRIRVEHWHHAIRHGQAAGLAAAGEGRPYAELPWFWSNQYEHNVQVLGWHRTWDGFEVRGSPEERSFVGFYLEGGAVRAAVALNRGRELRGATELIRAGAKVDPAALRDQSVDLRSLGA